MGYEAEKTWEFVKLLMQVADGNARLPRACVRACRYVQIEDDNDQCEKWRFASGGEEGGVVDVDVGLWAWGPVGYVAGSPGAVWPSDLLVSPSSVFLTGD